MTRWIPAALALFALSAAPTALARKGDVDFGDPKSVLKGAEFYGFGSNAQLSKKTGLPQKVAIGGFQIQYTFSSQEFGYGQSTTVRFSDEDYREITDALRDQLATFLEARGYEVVPHETVLGSQVYQALQGKEDAKVKDWKAIYPASGMQRLTWITVKPDAQPNMLAGLNEELGTDAVLFVTANFSVCEMGGGKKTRGTKICMGTPISGANRAETAGRAMGATLKNYKALEIHWLMGSKTSHGIKGQTVWSPKWVGSIMKSGIGSPMVAMDTNIRKQVKKGLFGGRYSTDHDAFLDGAFTLWDTALTLGFAPYEAERAKLAKKLK